jgi:hypothetical protein
MNQSGVCCVMTAAAADAGHPAAGGKKKGKRFEKGGVVGLKHLEMMLILSSTDKRSNVR